MTTVTVSAQGTQGISMYKTVTSEAKSRLSLQELPELFRGSRCCSPALRHSPGVLGAAPSASRQMPLSFCPIPVFWFPVQDRATGTFWDCPGHLGQLNSLWLSPSYLCAYHCPLALVPNLQGEEGMAGLSWTILTPRECPVGCGDSGSTPQLWSPAGFQELQSSCHHGFHVRTPVSIHQSGRLAQERNFPMLSPHCLTSWQIYHIGLEFIMLDFTS